MDYGFHHVCKGFGTVGDTDAGESVAGCAQALGAGGEWDDVAADGVGREVLIGDVDEAAGDDHGSGVQVLLAIANGKRDHHSGESQRCQLRHHARTGAGDDKVGAGVGLFHIRQVVNDVIVLGGRSQRGNVTLLALACDVENLETGGNGVLGGGGKAPVEFLGS